MSQAFPGPAWEANDVPDANLWEADNGDDPEGWGAAYSDDEDVGRDPKLVAASEFLEMLGSLFMASKISAQSYCVLCYYASKSGMPGDVAKHGIRVARLFHVQCSICL
jgi:hypothetical protein